MDEKTFQQQVTEDIKRMVRRMTETPQMAKEVCIYCAGTGRAIVADEDCVFCGGNGWINVEGRT